MKSIWRNFTSLSIWMLLLWLGLIGAMVVLSLAAINSAKYSFGEASAAAEVTIFACLMIVLWVIGTVVAFSDHTAIAVICMVFSVLSLVFIVSGGDGQEVALIVQPAFLPLVLLGGLIVFAVRLAYKQQNRALLFLLNDITNLNQPVESMIDAAARSSSGSQQRRLEKLRDRLQAGDSISAALHYVTPRFPGSMLGSFAAAERIGQLPRTLRRVCDRIRHRPTNSDGNTFYLVYYSAFVLMVGLLVCFLVVLYVMPKFQQIFHDFGVKLPWVTMRLISLANVAISWPAFALLVLVVAFVLIGSVFSPRISRRKAIADRLYALPGVVLIGRLLLQLPIVGNLIVSSGLSDLCSLATDATRAKLPLAETLSQGAAAQSNRWLRRRVMNWADRLNRGQDISEAAVAEQFPPLLVGMLAAALGSSDIADVFSFLSHYYESRLRRSRAILYSFLVPVVVLMLGSGVCFVAMSIVQAMAALDMHTANLAGIY